ncbi:helix-hairpin-helix domain-containing protein [Tissierella praeacuta]|uniref:helix-hairpin-helix domain-containing protein n=1 Tax=Tissierella praeacuta TaxID=43131 RepID=UPI001C0F86EC|nr:helix-hairpin-helix domain-containing protein [Tissierella praeacuta]MBU5256763.1 helix-hairpin-helix domain-containing protein [Tissierella praeacuta]
MDSFTKKEQIGILLIVFIIIITLGFKFFMKDIIKPKDDIMEIISFGETINLEEDRVSDNENKIIMVHISGQVYNPGIVELEIGDRVIDAVKLAGGLKKDADIDKINLAKKLEDEEKVHIPKIGEELTSDIIHSNDFKEKSLKTNINTCAKEELVSLPGIGDVIADRIIEYRKGNTFKSIEDIKNVSGIGDKKFEGIKELITVK